MDLEAYRSALLDAARRFMEGRHLPAAPSDAVALPERQAGGLGIRLWLDRRDETIVAARHDGQAKRDLLDVFCTVLVGLSIDEAANHGAAYTLHRIAGVPMPAGMGILNPVELFASLALAQRILRTLRDERRRAGEKAPADVARYLSLPQSWLDLPMAAKLERIRTAIDALLKEIGAPADLFAVGRVENDIRQRPVRVILTHAKDENSAAALPGLMRKIEHRLRQEVAPWLEVYSEEKADRNALRRMILQESRPADPA